VACPARLGAELLHLGLDGRSVFCPGGIPEGDGASLEVLGQFLELRIVLPDFGMVSSSDGMGLRAGLVDGRALPLPHMRTGQSLNALPGSLS
jgi:hypothetical protein